MENKEVLEEVVETEVLALEETNEEEIEEVKSEFKEFLETKGVKAKFSLAFNNMKKSASLQHEKDVESFNAAKERSKEENKEFYEFLHTKGIKAKFKLIIENIKKGAKESKEKTKAQIEHSKKLSNPNLYTVNDLNMEFNSYLKRKGLDKKYTITIEEIK